MIFHFGPFMLDSLARRLTCEGAAVSLPDRHLDVLLRLLAQPGDVIAKDALVEAAWPDVAVTDNSLEQAISLLRKSLTGHGILIETVPRRGYRLVAEVRREAPRHSDAELDAFLAPHRAWLEGRAALETLSVQKVGPAERAFRAALEAMPGHAPAHVGLANALIFRFEATRIDDSPDVTALMTAITHARDACRVTPLWAEAWATLGFALHRAGRIDEGMAAVGRAVQLEPDNWRHHLRLAFTSWGEARLRAAQRTLQLLPGLALAHWLAASVHVARQAFDAAERELNAGAAAQDQQSAGAVFGGVGLHWLTGLLRLATGDSSGAARHFDRELAFEDSGHLYTRECCAATWYAKGALAIRGGDRVAARAAFGEARRRVPGHLLALAADGTAPERADSEFAARLESASGRGALVDVAVARAVRDVAGAREPDPHQVLQAIERSPLGSSGWFLPVEPMLAPLSSPVRWAPALALVGSRAA